MLDSFVPDRTSSVSCRVCVCVPTSLQERFLSVGRSRQVCGPFVILCTRQLVANRGSWSLVAVYSDVIYVCLVSLGLCTCNCKGAMTRVLRKLSALVTVTSCRLIKS